MDLFWATLALVADNPSLQEKLSGPMSKFVKANVPSADDKALGDFFCRLGSELGGSAPAAS